MHELLVPDWPAPPTVHALQTTRTGGVSGTPWDSFNLGRHVGDDPAHVAANRASLSSTLPSEPVWLNQVHGTQVLNAATCLPGAEADASFARLPGVVCAVLTADCLPVLLCDRAGTVVAAAHAGWRGLAGGILEATVARMQIPPDQLLAWLGPAIGPENFEVGDEVRAAFVATDASASEAFQAKSPGKWQADIYQLARLRLARAGVGAVSGGGRCTVVDAGRFFSYRRDGVTGRMATMIWLGGV